MRNVNLSNPADSSSSSSPRRVSVLRAVEEAAVAAPEKKESVVLSINHDIPPKDSIFWTLWTDPRSKAFAEEALDTDFVKGVKHGNLDPVQYGGFNVSDAYYCFNGAADYFLAADRVDEYPCVLEMKETLRFFLTQKGQSYEEFNETFPKIWRIKDASGVLPFDSTKDYSDFEKKVATEEHPIYTLFAMLPCEYLYYWLAHSIQSGAGDTNLYSDWITGNLYPDGAYAMGNFLDEFMKENPGVIDVDKAIDIFITAMGHEAKNFAAATSS